MKKICFAMLSALCLLFLFSCAAQEKTLPALPFEARVLIERGEEKTSALVSVREDGSETLAIDGFVFRMDEKGNCTVSSADVTFPVSVDLLPDAGQLSRALCSAQGADLLKSEKKENGGKTTVLTLVGDACNYIFTLDRDGKLTRIVSEGKLPMSFVFEDAPT